MARQETRHDEALELRKRVGARICEAQAANAIKNEELAARVGLSLRLLQKHRAGDNLPSVDNLIRYAHVLDRTVAWFFAEEEVAA